MNMRSIILSMLGTILVTPCVLASESMLISSGDLQKLREKQELFDNNSQNHAFCSSSLSFQECIDSVDKLLTLSTSNLFPTAKFDSIFITDKNSNVDMGGSVAVDFKATTDEMRAHLAAQTNDYQILEDKLTLFSRQSQNDAFCASRLTFAQCVQGLDNLLVLSTTDLFPNSNFDFIYITDRFEDVDTGGSVAVDFKATIDAVKSHLAAQ